MTVRRIAVVSGELRPFGLSVRFFIHHPKSHPPLASPRVFTSVNSGRARHPP